VFLFFGWYMVAAVTLITTAVGIWIKSSWQIALVVLIMATVVGWSCYKNKQIYKVASDAAVAASRKNPSLVFPLPGLGFGDDALVASGTIHKFSDVVRDGKIIAVGEEVIGTIESTNLERGPLTMEQGVTLDQPMVRLPMKKGIR
jgi:hypothetical protein